MEGPETLFAWNGKVALAYQVVGEGPVDLVYLQGYCSHVDLNWESPYLAGLLRALARDARLIITDRRGFGCSDRFSPTDIPPFEVFADDILAVMSGISAGCRIRDVGLRTHRDDVGGGPPRSGGCRNRC